MPMALEPSSDTMVTRSLEILPRTISAISMVSGSVTRRPLMNCASLPLFLTQVEIALPPPWTMMGLKPTSFKSVTSRMTSFCSQGSDMADPPYLTTMILRLKVWI